MITGIYVNAVRCTHETVTVDDTLESYYKLLDVETNNIVTRKIGGVYYDIVCDDEALQKPVKVASMIDEYGWTMLVGNLFIVRSDGEGGLVSLTDDDVSRILGCLKKNMVLPYIGIIGDVLEGDY